MREFQSPSIINQSIRYSSQLPVVYTNNPKVACSSVKAALWRHYDELTHQKTYSGKPHDRNSDPFVDDIFSLRRKHITEMMTKKFFTIVRNPYNRILSGYLDKIGRAPDIHDIFCKRFYLDKSRTSQDTLPFRDFVQILYFEYPPRLDPHFRPQFLNTLFHHIDFAFIGSIEDMDPTYEFLSNYGIQLEKYAPHETHAARVAERYYTDDIMQDVRKVYSMDFDTFGYDKNCLNGMSNSEFRARVGVRGLEFPELCSRKGGVPNYINIMPSSSEYKFYSAKDAKERKVEVEKTWCHIVDPLVLRDYVRFAERNGLNSLRDAIENRYVLMTMGHLDVVKNKSIIADGYYEMYKRHADRVG